MLNTPLVVSIPRLNGVASKSKTEFIYFYKIACYIAAPYATQWSGFNDYNGFFYIIS